MGLYWPTRNPAFFIRSGRVSVATVTGSFKHLFRTFCLVSLSLVNNHNEIFVTNVDYCKIETKQYKICMHVFS